LTRARAVLGFSFFLFISGSGFADLEKYRDLVVRDPEPSLQDVPHGLRVTYLGVNGYEFEADGHSLFVDPYFTRVSLWQVALNRPITSSEARIAEAIPHLNRACDAILVTHAHFDHLLDVPKLMRPTHARLLAGPTAVELVESLGVSSPRCVAVQGGDVQRLGPWTIRVFGAQHDRLLGSVPFPNKEQKHSGPPVRPADWTVGEPLAFLIEANGKRIYIESGGIPGEPIERTIGHVDLAIIGVALSDSRRRFAEIVGQLQPRYVLPSHQDDFFQPFDRGFVFGPLTDFPEVINLFRKEHLVGRLVLLDYFHPWTIP
jgi:L-ascorbate metabolism protein UlaG (beta-lactamase superfamily)